MQLNVELPDTDLKRIKKDAVEMGVTLNEYALQAFLNFLAKPIASRRVYFDKNTKKVLGRKIKV